MEMSEADPLAHHPYLGEISKKLVKPITLSILRNKHLHDSESGTIDHITLTRYKPESLDSLCKSTKFTKREIQIMYRGFKQECPTGMVNEETFKHVYGQFFPQGDSSNYAHYVFRTLDKNDNKCITFEEFLKCLSELIYGSDEDKLRWAFKLYAQEGNDYISRVELANIITAIYDMMGAKTTPPIDQSTVEQHVERIMSEASSSSDSDQITYDSFRALCLKDRQKSTATFHEFATDLRLRN